MKQNELEFKTNHAYLKRIQAEEGGPNAHTNG